MTALPAELDVERAYRLMRLLREFEDQLHIAIQRGTVPGFTHLYAGEEASAVGVCLHLTDSDVLCSTHRAHGHFLAKGGDIDALALEIFGKQGGVCGGKGGSMHVADWSRGLPFVHGDDAARVLRYARHAQQSQALNPALAAQLFGDKRGITG